MNTISGRLSKTGALTVPAKLRAAAGLEPGSAVVLDLVDGELRIRSVAQALASAERMAPAIVKGRRGAATVDAFIAERRREAAREP
ncbi:MAG TPA: AbrB/MazE/SpoVT family DNA-binding domain-containing protein [Caulobacteraceae bacterium]|nr:AbrB/MazE/SpoVT family DNA-binding domain-containing protein [Caulobacteraceae bacterium]